MSTPNQNKNVDDHPVTLIKDEFVDEFSSPTYRKSDSFSNSIILF